MGITGLIPFLEKSSKKINIRDIRGSTVAVDTYCWLHKGVFSCAERLVRGEKTDMHIQYCLKYVNMLLAYDIKPILVFDGQHLPAKAQTEKKRRENRKLSKERALELVCLGRSDEARSYFRRCVDVTHKMALELIQECHKINVDCVVAPYEADAQLAFLNKRNIAEYIVTEDSDLVLFGCEKILFKLDLTGNCLMVDASTLHLSMGCHLQKYSFDKFLHMCILSGCDYLDSLPGIGLAKACKFVLKTDDDNIRRALAKIPAYLNMRHLDVSEEYKDDFLKAIATFKHMFVYDPIQRNMTRLTSLDDTNIDIEYCCNAGSRLADDVAFQLALGNLNPFSLVQLDDWNPDNNLKLDSIKSTSRNKSIIAKHKSVWRQGYKTCRQEKISSMFKKDCAKSTSTKSFSLPEEYEEIEEDTEEKTEEELLNLYGKQPPNKKYKFEIQSRNCKSLEIHQNSDQSLNTKNPFIKKPSNLDAFNESSSTTITKENSSLIKNLSPTKKCAENIGKLKKLSKFDRTVISNDDNQVVSRFFAKNLQHLELDESEKTGNDNFNKDSADEIDIAIQQTSKIHISPRKKDNSTDGIMIEGENDDEKNSKCKVFLNYEDLQPTDIKEINSLDGELNSTSKPLNKLESFRMLPKKNFTEYNPIGKNIDLDIVNVSSEEETVSNNVNNTVNLEKSLSSNISTKSIVYKSACRRLGLPKPRQKIEKNTSSQSRLSMFGFKKSQIN